MRTPRHSTVVAYVALFAALGGTATAAGIARNSVGSPQIRNGSVQVADLAKSARPTSSASIRAVVTDQMTSDQVLSALSTAVKGEKGDPGAPVQGSTGPQGASGAKGDAGAQGAEGSPGPAGQTGDIRAFGVIRVTNSDSQTYTANTQGATLTHPGLGVWCITAGNPALTAIVAIPDAVNAVPMVMSPNDSRNTCAPGHFLVAINNSNGVDTGFSFVGS